MIGSPHILSVADVERGIEALAAKLLGSASLWPQLVQANKLSPPYLSLVASDVYGPPVASIALASALPAASDAITLPGYPGNVNLLYLSSAGESGIVAEAAPVANYSGGVFRLGTPTQNAYPAGSRLQLFSSYVLSNNILLPGNTLFVPVTTTSFTVSANQQLMDVFGSDIASPVSFVGGDLASVSGVATFLQRVRAVIQTAVGSLPLHLHFGSQLSHAVGRAAPTSVRWNALVTKALLQLPEVAQVSNVQVTVRGDIASVSAVVHVATSDAPLQLLNESFTIAA